MKFFSRIIKRLFKFIWIAVLLIVVILLGFHFWFINHSEKTMEDLITWTSGGKLKSSIKKFRLDYFHKKIDIKDLTIFNTDSSDESTVYRFNVRDFHLKVRSMWDFIFYKKLLIDSVIFNSPEIVVVKKTQHFQDTSSSKLLLAEELGNVYKAISQSLSVLNLQRFEINEGKVLINNTYNTNIAPFRLSHIFLSIDKFSIDSNSEKETGRFIFSDRILLRVNDQHILLPDNKSSVAFKELIIDSKEKLISITNPVINIQPGIKNQDSVAASASRLDITGLDFNALYMQQLIKTDSVFLQQPDAKMEIYIDERNDKTPSTKRTALDSALYYLPVSLNINHIVMQKGNAIIHLHQKNKITSFQTNNDNLSVKGFRLNDSSENFLDIDGFDYTIRNYVGFTPDSFYRFRFDSLQFIDNKIVLHHFNASTVKQTKTNLIRDYSVPRFEITGMDWASFIFENHFKARSAVLYEPILNIEKYNFSPEKDSAQPRSKKSIYQTLSVMDSLIDLDRLQIVNGSFSFRQKNSINLDIQRLNLNLDANELTKAKSVNYIVNSVKQMSFDSANASNASSSLSISKSSFDQKGKYLVLNDVSFHTRNNDIVTHFQKASLSDFSFDNNALEINGVRWNDSKIQITLRSQNSEKPSSESKAPSVFLRNIKGENTDFVFKNGKTSAEMFLKNISLSALRKPDNENIHCDSLIAKGNNVNANFQNCQLACNEFYIGDGENSILNDIKFAKITKDDTIAASVESVHFIPDINEAIEKQNIDLDSVKIIQPSIAFIGKKNKTKIETYNESVKIPVLNIKFLFIKDASFTSEIRNGTNKSEVLLPRLSLVAKNIISQQNTSLLFQNVSITANNFLFRHNDSISLNAKNRVEADLSKFLYQPSRKEWSAELDKFIIGNIQYLIAKRNNKKDSATLSAFDARNFFITSNDLHKPLQWLINRSHAEIKFDDAKWQTDNINLRISGFEFSQNKKRIRVNSFSTDPGVAKDIFVKNLICRKDYMQGSSKKIIIDEVEMNDNVLHIPDMLINDGRISVYSDKLVEAGPESVQPLPTDALGKIPVPVRIDNIRLNDLAVNYTELNADTRKTGSVGFTHINGNISNISSSQSSDSVRVNVHARFMDSLPLKLSLNESYDSPLLGLSIKLQLGPGDLHLLNSFLVPLTSMRAKSGYVDTMTMVAIGNDVASHGNMRLYYHDLKAEFLDSGSLKKKNFGTKLLNFFANTIAIRSHNNVRVAEFNFTRIKQKSSIGYLLQMIVEGSARSVAPMSAILLKKQDKKEIKNQETKSNN